MPDTINKGKIRQKTGANTSEILHPETDASIVIYDNTTSQITATTVQDAIDEIISTGVGVTGVKGDAETDYRTGQVNLTPANIGAEAAFTDGSATIATKSGDVVTIKAGVSQTAGAIGNSSGSDIALGTAAVKGVATSISSSSTDGDLATAKAVFTAIDNLPEPMVFKGTVGTSGTVEWANLPAASSSNEGYTYKVITKHTSAPICEVGDTIISNGSEWVVIPSGDEPSGTVTNIAASTGLTTSDGNPITTTGTVKANLVDETLASNASSYTAGGSTKFYAVQLDSNGKLAVYVPWENTNTATAADNILDGSNNGTEITYAPYATQQNKLSFDTSATNPTRTDRLNLNGYLYATKLYSNGNEVLTGTGVAAGTYSVVTVNSSGLVTAGSQVLAVVNNGVTPTDLAIGGWYFEKDA